MSPDEAEEAVEPIRRVCNSMTDPARAMPGMKLTLDAYGCGVGSRIQSCDHSIE